MVLRGLEEKLNAKLKSVEGSFYDLKEDLIKDASKLATQAAKAIEKLKSELLLTLHKQKFSLFLL